MSLRLGLIGYALGRAAGGIGRYSRELIAALAGCDVELTVLQAGPGVAPAPAVALRGAGLLPGLLTIGQLEIAWIARQRRLEVLHDPTGALPLLLAGAGRVATIHDAIPYVHPGASTALDWLIYHAWLPLAVRRLDALITDSQQSRHDLARFLPLHEEQITIIPAAVNANYRPLPEAHFLPALARAGLEQPYILYVGSLEPRKNLLRLLQAYALLRQWSPRWKLAVVGARNFWKSTPVVGAVQDLELAGQVIFTGFIPEEDLPAVYNGAELFVFPSLYEGFGLPVLEAMACGVPVITSNSSSLPEVAGEAALLIDPYDVQGLAEAMRRVLSDPELANELRQLGLARASLFTWQRTAQETIAVYERVLRQRR